MESLLREEEQAAWIGEGKAHWSSRLQAFLFNILYVAFLTEETSETYLSAPGLVLENGLFFAHVFSLVDWTDTRLRDINWVLRLTRVDVLARYIGFTSQLAWLHLLINGMPLIGLVLTSVEAVPRQIARAVVALPTWYLVKVAFVPILALHGRLLRCLFGSCRSNDEGQEDLADMKWEQVLSLPVLTLTLFYAYFYHSLIYRIAGFRRTKRQCRSLSHSFPIKSNFYATVFTVACHVFATNQPFLTLLSAFAFCKSLYDLLRNLPHFSLWVNAMKACLAAGLCWVYTVKTLTEVAGDVSAFFLVLIVSWPLGVLAYQYAFRRFRSCKEANIDRFAHICDLDFATRYHLASGYQPETIKSMYKSAYRTLQSDLIIVWEASILLGFSSDPIDSSLLLALNPPLKGSSFELAFQRFILLKDAEKYSNTNKYHLEFLLNVEEVRKSDETLCQFMLQFCNNLLNSVLSVGKFERLVLRIVDEKRYLSKKYKSLTAKYKGERQVNALYGTLMLEILGNLAGQALLIQSESTSSQEHGVICLHAGYMCIGQIAVFNSVMQSLLKADARDLKNQPCTSILPKSLQSFAISTLKKAISASDMSEIELLFSFITDTAGFLMNLKVTCKMVAWKQMPIFFLSFKQGKDHQMLLIDCEGRIVGQSKGVCQEDVTGMRIENLYEDYRLGDTGDMRIVDKLTGETMKISVTSLRLEGEIFYQLSQIHTSHRIESLSFTCSKEVRFISMSLDPSQSVVQSFLPDQSLKQHVLQSVDRSKVALSTSSTVATAEAMNRVFGNKMRIVARRSNLLALLAYLSVIGMVLGVLFTIGHVVDELLNQDSIRAIGRQRYLSIETAHAVRAISLIQSGFLTQTESLYRSMLQSDLYYYSAAMNETSSKLPTWPAGPYKAMHFAPVVPQWIYYDSEPQAQMMGLLQVMTLMMRATVAVNTSQYVNFTNSNVQYIFRNGPAENSVYQNKSIFLFLEAQRETRMQELAVTDALVVSAALLLLAVLGMLVVPQVVATEKLNREIWRRLYEVPKEGIIELRLKVIERLEEVHGLEGAIERIERAQKTPIPRPIWTYYAAQMLLLLLVSGLFFGLVFTGPYSDIQAKLTTLPNFLNWGQLFHLYFEGSCFWNSELYLQQFPNISHTHLLSNSEYWRFPELLLSKYQRDFAFANSLLASPHPEFGIFTTDISDNFTDFQLSHACDQVTVSNCSNSALSLGQIFAATEFMQQMRDTTATIGRGKAKRTEVYACESRRKVVTAGRRFLNTILEAELKVSVQTDFALVRTAVILYCAGLVLIYFGVNWTIVRFLTARMKRVAEMLHIVGKKC